MAGAYLNIIKGDTYVYQTNVAVDGVAANVSAANLWFTAVDNPSTWRERTLIDVSSVNGQIVVSGSNGNVVTLTLNANSTANYTESPALFWALRCQLATGQVYTLDRGRAAIVSSLVSSP